MDTMEVMIALTTGIIGGQICWLLMGGHCSPFSIFLSVIVLLFLL